MEINQPICIFLIGLPASGKSTFCKNQMDELFPDQDFVKISSDEYIENHP